MLKTETVDGLRVVFRDENRGNGATPREIFFALRAGTPARVGVVEMREMPGSTTGAVFRVVLADGRKFVFKHERREHHAFDHWVQSFLFGSNTERLIRGMDADENFRKIPAAEVFLIADRRKWGAVTESFLLTEFVEGELLGSIPGYREKFGAEVAALLARMHAAGLVHGDVHERNFILRKTRDESGERAQVVAIDVSGKRCTPFSRAEDRIRAEWTLGVKNALRDWGARAFALKFRLRNLGRRLRGKPEFRAPGQ